LSIEERVGYGKKSRKGGGKGPHKLESSAVKWEKRHEKRMKT